MAETATLAAPTVADRVAAGAAYLDERRPGWWADIDLTQFDIRHSCRCVLGQLYGDYYAVKLPLEEAVKLGFDAEGNEYGDGMWLDFDALQAEWTRVVAARYAAPMGVTGDGA